MQNRCKLAYFSVLFALLSACAPKTQEDCIDRATKQAKSDLSLRVLMRQCETEFPGKLRPGGGYTYFDPQSGQWIDVSGPTLSNSDLTKIASVREEWTKSQQEAAARVQEAQAAQAQAAQQERAAAVTAANEAAREAGAAAANAAAAVADAANGM